MNIILRRGPKTTPGWPHHADMTVSRDGSTIILFATMGGIYRKACYQVEITKADRMVLLSHFIAMGEADFMDDLAKAILFYRNSE